MHELTPFQVACEAVLNVALAQFGAGLIDRQLSGLSETYIRARIDGTDLEVYEAQVQGPRVDERFEAPDFKSRALLCEAFVLKATELARNAVG